MRPLLINQVTPTLASCLVIAACAAPNGTTAVDSGSLFSEVSVIAGRCERLTVFDTDMTANCVDRLLFTATPNGRVQALATLKRGSTVMFAGSDLPNPTANTDASSVDRIYLNSPLGSSASGVFPARGRCTYTNPYAAPMIVDCKAELVEGGESYQFRFKASAIMR